MSNYALSSLKSVLSSLGWQKETTGRIGELWSDGSQHRVGIPFELTPEAPEWQDALERVAHYSFIAVEELSRRIERFGYDVSSFKVDGPTLDRTVSVDAGFNLFKTARQALRASATTARQRKAIIGNNYSTAGDRVVARSRFGQTEEGSYMVPLLIPIGDVQREIPHQPQIDGATTLFQQAKIETTERRVTRTMAESLSAISHRLIQPARTPTQGQVEELVEVGVSRELLATLTDVLKPEGTRDFAVSFTWHETEGLQPPAVDASISIPADSSEILKEATELISRAEEPVTESFSGPIVELRHDRERSVGHVVLDAIRAGKKAEILVPLRGEQLEIAHRWFESRDTIFVAGAVERVSGRWRIDVPERLKSFSDPTIPGL